MEKQIGTEGRIEISHRCGAGKAGIRHDECGVVVGSGLGHPCGGQTGHRWSESDTRLIIECQYAGVADGLVGNVAGFVTGG